jgi:hypothetical protein
MKASQIIGRGGVAALVVATCAAAQAGALTVVEVAAPAVNCVFQAICVVTVTDSTAELPLNFSAGTPFLQSRTFSGAAGTPAAGHTGYEYRVDMRTAGGAVDCVVGLVINFGPVTKLPYILGAKADVYVVTKGGLGTIGIKSAEQDGDVITFEFAKPMCVQTNPGAGESTFFFGLASNKPPHEIAAGMYGIGTPPFISLVARAPNY